MEEVLAATGKLLDFTKPVDLLFVACLHNIPDHDDPAGIVARYLTALAPGSYLVISHVTDELDPDRMHAITAEYAKRGTVFVGRSKEAIQRIFDDTELADPGVVPISYWRPDSGQPDYNAELIHANLACMWENFRRAGASRPLLCRVLEARSLLRRVAEAVPGADITVVRLRAPRDLVQARIMAREAGRDPQWYLDTAAYLFDRLEHAGVEDHVVDNDDRPVAQVAADVLHAAGWLGARSPDRR